MTTTLETLVFVGPTLRPELAARELKARYLPPAAQGAIYAAARRYQPAVIVLIDGVFASVPAVRHKEILWAMSRGSVVYGAASMGALRAAELSPYGMIGHGLIYRWYRATPLADDDEVAIAMAPVELGARPLGEALINMRVTLRRAQRCGLLPLQVRQELEQLARSIHFLERTYATLFAKARNVLSRQYGALIDELEAWTAVNAVDQKQADAIELLQFLASPSGQRRSPIPITPPFQLTETWAHDLEIAVFEIDDFCNCLVIRQ